MSKITDLNSMCPVCGNHSMGTWWQTVRTLITELRADHATMRTEVIAIGTTLADVKAKYEAHRHSVAGAASTGTAPSTVAATAEATASTITDTSGSSVPATLAAADVTTLA